MRTYNAKFNSVEAKTALGKMMPLIFQAIALFLLLRDHPYWNPEFKRTFGIAGLVGVTALQLIGFIAFIVLTDPDTIWLYPLLAWAAFIFGTCVAMFGCYEIRILSLALYGKINLSKIWTASQILGLVLVVSAFCFVRLLDYPSVADGYSIYMLIVGAGLIVCTTAVYWRRIKREEKV